jgi:hypothetical protein
MAGFEPTAKQQKIIETAERLFDARLAQPKPKSSAFSRYFVEKCSSELGIEPHKPRVGFLQRKIIGALKMLFG